MEKQAIYKRIREIAYASDKDGGVCLRADLAYELKAFGLGNDSVELNTLVWEAYRYFQEDKVIRSVFMDNRNLDSLADLGQIWDMVDRLDADVLSPLLYSRLERGEKSLEGLNVLLSNIADYSSKSTGVDVMNSIVGTKGVAAVQGKASDMFSRYSAMIGGYQDARVVVSSLISDFTTLRSQVCDIYRRYSAMLVDVFGDSIKAVDPQLFDFDQIEWLDTRGMIQNVKLEYDKVLEKCKVLAGSISDSFRLSLNQSVGAYRTAGSKTAGLAIAGLNMFLHYAEAAQQTAELEQDLLKLKNIVKHDVVVVKGDLSRLTVIYKTMNDVFVPKADVFFRYAGQVLTVEWQQLEDELYGKSGVQELKHERD